MSQGVSKRAVPRHRKQVRQAADRQERAIEKAARQKARKEVRREVKESP